MSLEALGKRKSRDSSLMGSDAGFGWVIPDVSKERSALILKDQTANKNSIFPCQESNHDVSVVRPVT